MRVSRRIGPRASNAANYAQLDIPIRDGLGWKVCHEKGIENEHQMKQEGGHVLSYKEYEGWEVVYIIRTSFTKAEGALYICDNGQ